MLVFLLETLYSLFISLASHVLGEVSVCSGLFLLIGDVDPGQDRILGDVIVIPTCDLVKPLQILIIGH